MTRLLLKGEDMLTKLLLELKEMVTRLLMELEKEDKATRLPARVVGMM